MIKKKTLNFLLLMLAMVMLVSCGVDGGDNKASVPGDTLAYGHKTVAEESQVYFIFAEGLYQYKEGSAQLMMELPVSDAGNAAAYLFKDGDGFYCTDLVHVYRLNPESKTYDIVSYTEGGTETYLSSRFIFTAEGKLFYSSGVTGTGLESLELENLEHSVVSEDFVENPNNVCLFEQGILYVDKDNYLWQMSYDGVEKTQVTSRRVSSIASGTSAVFGVDADTGEVVSIALEDDQEQVVSSEKPGILWGELGGWLYCSARPYDTVLYRLNITTGDREEFYSGEVIRSLSIVDGRLLCYVTDQEGVSSVFELEPSTGEKTVYISE